MIEVPEKETGVLKHRKVTEEVQEKAALYALGALTQQEARFFEFHLVEGCSACQTLVQHFERVAGTLGYAAADAEPAFYLRDLLAARIEREPRPFGSTPEPQSGKTVPSEPEGPEFRPQSLQAAPRQRSIVPWALAAVTATIALVCFLSWRAAEERLKVAVREESGRSAAIRAEADRLRGLLEADQAKSREIEQINLALSSPGTKMYLLVPQLPDVSAEVVLFWNRQENRGILLGHLPSAPPGKDYQLWFMTPPDSKVSEGLLNPDSTGRCFSIINIPPVLTQITAVAITLEPKGGSVQPTTRAFALSK